MTGKKISALVFTAFILFLFVGSIIKAHYLKIEPPAVAFGDAAATAANVEGFFRKSIPLSRTLKRFRIMARYELGDREQNGVFITENRLIENIAPPVGAYVAKNIDSALRFTEQQTTPVFIALVPTASAILQSDTPQFADIFDQKLFIENVYKNFSGKLSCIDVYSALFQNRQESLYYNTETLLSPQGGYFVYNVVAKRMGLTPYPFYRFDIEYLDNQYLGSLSRRIDYEKVAPDNLAIYRFTGSIKEFSVKHLGTEEKEYNTLYPKHLLSLGEALSVYLGGRSPVTVIEQRQRAQNHLLLLADKQAFSVVPFLACNYQKITLVDLSSISTDELVRIKSQSYDEILMLYSTDTFMHENYPARINDSQRRG